MHKKIVAYTLCVCALSSVWADEEQVPSQEIDPLVADSSHVFLMDRSESIPPEHIKQENVDSDHYLEGYIQALVDMHFYEHQVVVSVKEGVVYLYNLPHNEMLSNSIISFVQDLPCVCEVKVMEKLSCEEIEKKKPYASEPRVDGIWFPQSTVLFAPLVANPREITYSVAWRAGDQVVGRKAIAVSLGDDFPIFRWRNVFRWCGDMQIGIQACVWSVFNFDHVPHKDDTYCELFNSDFFLGFPLTYAVDRWAFRLRLYHISSHLGDEFICNRPRFCEERVNPSFEALDFFTSYQFSKNLRGYFGPGVILHSDCSFPMKSFYVEYGAELRILGSKLSYHRLYGTPFLAIDIQNWQVRNWDFDFTVKAGYELSKLAGIGRKMRIYAEYHHGFSEEGQFFLRRTQYGEFGFSWGF